MAKIKLESPEFINEKMSQHVKTRRAVRDEVNKRRKRADRLLSDARAKTKWERYNAPYQTKIEPVLHDADGYVWMEGPNAMAIEFGHKPSGAHAKDDPTSAPQGLYIITRTLLG